MAPTADLIFFLLMSQTLAAALSFSSGTGRALSFSEFSTSSLSSLDPYSDYVEVNISLNDSSSLSFLNVYAPPIRSSPMDSRTDFFSSAILPSHVEGEAVEFSRFCFRFRFHRKRTASTASASSFRFRVLIANLYGNNFLTTFYVVTIF